MRGGAASFVVGTGAAFVGGMNCLFFGFKRAFHSTLRVSRIDFKEIQLTPARMDALYAIDQERRSKGLVWQSVLRHILGYSARSTLTEMLRALEELGWVRRKRSKRDARQREVELTKAGQAKLAKAHWHFCATDWAFEAPYWAKDWPKPTADESQAWDSFLEKAEVLDKILSNVRFALRDTSTLFYPWAED